MSKKNRYFELDDTDKRCLKRIEGFLPEKVFDMHTHIWDCKTIPGFMGEGSLFDIGIDKVGYDELKKFQKVLYPGVKEWRNNFLTIPDPAMMEPGSDLFDIANAFMVAELDKHPENIGAMAVLPGMTTDDIKRYLVHDGIRGFKCYHNTAPVKPTWNSCIGEYLPESAWQVANERGMFITLHMVKDRALSDPDNLDYIIEKCKQYPNANLILAHAARGFAPYNTMDSIHSLRGLQNVYFDCAAVSEPKGIVAILKEFGPSRLLWGSDFPVSMARGRCIGISDSFYWIYSDELDLLNPNTKYSAALVGTEGLLAIKLACDEYGCSKKDIEDIFYNNAMRLTGLVKPSGTITRDLYIKGKNIFPGGTHLLSKRPELQAPGVWPAYFTEARGCEIWDADGRHYYDMGTNAVGAALLGYGDADVDRAAMRRVNMGVISSLNPVDEVEAAERLLGIHPWAECVRFGRPGGEIGAVAIRIARATTDRSKVAISGYHGWHDWYLAANLGEDDTLRGHLLPGLAPIGVPRELRGTTLAFNYGSFEEFDKLMSEHGDEMAAVIMEPARNGEPPKGFLEHVRSETKKRGILLIFDEVSIGFRVHIGGSHLRFGVTPDMATFGKSLGNGYSMAAVIGTRAAMEGAHSSFISSSYWTESIGPAVACAVMEKHSRIDVPAYVDKIGRKVKDMWNRLSVKNNVSITVNDQGFGAWANFAFNHEKAQELRTLYVQLMLDRGFLAPPVFTATMAHNDDNLGLYAIAVDEVFGEIARIVKADKITESLRGQVCQSGFKRLI